MIWAIAFLVIGALCAWGCVSVLLSVTDYRMAGSEAIRRDGLARGDIAPRWRLADSSGALVSSPGDELQLILFADHSLKDFPGVIEQVRNIGALPDAPELIVLMRHPNQLAKPLMDVVGLSQAKVVTGRPALYGRYNVRVMPFAMFIDGQGRVRASSLVNEGWQMLKLWSLAHISLESPAPSAPGRRDAEAV